MMTKQEKLFATGARRPRALLLAAALLLASGTAAAQYVWIDGSGHKVYSDRSPPASVPLKNILKAPNLAEFQRAAAAADAADAAEVKAKDSPPPKAPPTLAERNADYIKRQAAEQEKAKKDAEDAKQKADKQRSCDSMRENQKLMDSGIRLSTINAAGERGYMTDAEKAQKVQENQRALANCN